jgi:hypothetical protein
MTTGAATATPITIPIAAICPRTDVRQHQRPPRIPNARVEPMMTRALSTTAAVLFELRSSYAQIAGMRISPGPPLGMTLRLAWA